ncbi:unnamed protein product [Vitrella brassicaformis CCMP3155]|uniref:Prolyl 4-hydroxylase alpha subunit domain-containing protein n=1 Tax=Vitrella brassicaformis (strain CCMP3155) TaxID=1169540 RepID=A0A0G4EX57_VITBC|nr:unnamed protein product [Vitrella brassicaformis CCMP3155]|eukprot:CEM03261.1 unnamed protein product [Vitrella brassicaformis CCMP3155]
MVSLTAVTFLSSLAAAGGGIALLRRANAARGRRSASSPQHPYLTVLLYGTVTLIISAGSFYLGQQLTSNQLTLPLLVSEAPRIYLVERFLSRAECRRLIALAEAESAPHANSSHHHKGRRGEAFKVNLSERLNLTAALIDRMHRLTMYPPSHGERFQVVKYTAGHSEWNNNINERENKLHKDSNITAGRVATVLVFLSSVDSGGGELVFPYAKRVDSAELRRAAGIKGDGRDVREISLFGNEYLPPLDALCGEYSESLRIEPRQGRALIFFNHDPMLIISESDVLHGNCPVASGVKYTAQRFIRWFEEGEPNRLANIISLMRRRTM